MFRCTLSLLLAGALSGYASELDAVAISTDIQARHSPWGAILDPIFASPTSDQIVGYTRCGDSALWTGAYLATEAFRYKVTQSVDALSNVRRSLAALKGLADVTGYNLLARCMVPADSPYAAGIRNEEVANGVYSNPPWIWVGHTSRDQFVGAIFGLGATYDLIDDPTIKSGISDLVTRLIGFLTGHNWSVVMPDGSSSTTFLVRPDEILALLQVGRHVNPDKFNFYYDEQRILLSATVAAPPLVDTADDGSYFKFNLDYMSFYNLVRLESSSARGIYDNAYGIVRGHTVSHRNPFFDLVDRALEGRNTARDAETRVLIEQWLSRPKRDLFVDDTGGVPVCGSQACQPIPIPMRPPTDFLWQRSPFQLSGGGTGLVLSAGIDYILPYWMGRYYGVVSPLNVQSSAAAISAVAADSIASLYGSNLGQTVTVTDSAGASRVATLIYASPQLINFVVPEGTASGVATLLAGNETTTATIQNVAPALYTMNGTGSGVAAAVGLQGQGTVPVFQCAMAGCISVPIALSPATPTYLSLYGTGIRHRSSVANVQVTINGVSVPVLYAGLQPTYAGLDQVNISLPLDLRGAGESDLILTVDGKIANIVRVNIK